MRGADDADGIHHFFIVGGIHQRKWIKGEWNEVHFWSTEANRNNWRPLVALTFAYSVG